MKSKQLLAGKKVNASGNWKAKARGRQGRKQEKARKAARRGQRTKKQ